LVEQTLDSQGDELIERQEWQLQTAGPDIVGFWQRSRTWVSGDGVPFACNSRPRYTESWRYLFRGRGDDNGARLKVTRWFREPGRCQSDQLPVESCRLAREGRFLLADCGQGLFRLERRLDSPVPLDLAEHPPGSLTGVWTWNLRSTDGQGDVKLEAETWQLRQHGNQLAGHYDRHVTVRSGDGRRFRCNQQLHYTSRARFVVRGGVEGRHLHLEEVSFSAVPDPCETGYRSLDHYVGVVDPRGGASARTCCRGRSRWKPTSPT
jgi:hypothetical protein